MNHRPTLRRPVAALSATIAVGSMAACGDEPQAAPRTEASTSTGMPIIVPPPDPTTPAAPPTREPLPDGVIDPTTLPRSTKPFVVDRVVGQTIHLDGRTIETDLPGDASVGIMGLVDDLVVLAGTVGTSGSTRFWSVDPSGHALPLGRSDYTSYNYAPVLVEETGHVWINYDDRGTLAKRIWELDVRTGEQLLELRDGEAPPTLDPADQAVVDVFSGNGGELPAVDEPSTTSPDGSLETVLRDVNEQGESRYSVVVRRVGGGVVSKVTFAQGGEVADHDERLDTCTAPPRRGCYVYVGVGRPRFEDDSHVIFSVGVSTADTNGVTPSVDDDAIVRCDLEGACELATDLGDAVYLYP